MRQLRQQSVLALTKKTILEQLELQRPNRSSCEGKTIFESCFLRTVSRYAIFKNCTLIYDENGELIFNAYVKRSCFTEEQLSLTQEGPGVLSIKDGSVGCVEYDGIISKYDRHLTAKIWCNNDNSATLE